MLLHYCRDEYRIGMSIRMLGKGSRRLERNLIFLTKIYPNTRRFRSQFFKAMKVSIMYSVSVQRRSNGWRPYRIGKLQFALLAISRIGIENCTFLNAFYRRRYVSEYDSILRKNPSINFSVYLV